MQYPGLFGTSFHVAARLLLGTSILSLCAADALAQETGAPATEAVTVTGSRIEQPGFTSPTPVQAVTAGNMDKVALTVREAIATLPAVVTTGGGQQTSSGACGSRNRRTA